MNIGFYGASKVGTSLATYFQRKGFRISGFYSRSHAHALESATLTDTQAFETVTQLVAQSDWIFVTVSDAAIAEVSAQIAPHLSEQQALFHCSGVATIDLLHGTYRYALHPLYAFPSKETSLTDAVLFTLEGNEDVEAVKQMLRPLGNPIQLIDAAQKVKYHAACVMASNFVNGLAYASQQLFESIGFSTELAEAAYQQLFLQNAQNIVARGAVDALTGPIERGDEMTVAKHLTALTPSEREMYQALAQLVVNVAEVKYPMRSFETMRRLLQ